MEKTIKLELTRDEGFYVSYALTTLCKKLFSEYEQATDKEEKAIADGNYKDENFRENLEHLKFESRYTWKIYKMVSDISSEVWHKYYADKYQTQE